MAMILRWWMLGMLDDRVKKLKFCLKSHCFWEYNILKWNANEQKSLHLFLIKPLNTPILALQKSQILTFILKYCFLVPPTFDLNIFEPHRPIPSIPIIDHAQMRIRAVPPVDFNRIASGGDREFVWEWIGLIIIKSSHLTSKEN